MATWADVVAAGTALPEVEEGMWWRTPALKVRGKSFCRMKEDGETLVVRVLDLEDKEALLRGDPERFYTTPHYDGHPTVLVNLPAVDVDELRELITESWLIRAPTRIREAYEDEVVGDA